jgi:hypothetical protein
MADQTIEERIAEIAQGFGQGVQNFFAVRDQMKNRNLQEEALKRQQALQAFEVSSNLSNQTGKIVTPEQVAPLLNSGNFTGIGDILKNAPSTQKSLQADEDRKLEQEYKRSMIDKNKRYDPNAAATAKANITAERKKSDSKIHSAEESAPGDMSLIFNYMKMLDPGSTVREGEYATAEQARGIDSNVLAMYNRAKSGERLTPQQRELFKSNASRLGKSQYDTYKSFTAPQRKRIQELGLDESQIFPSFSQQKYFETPAKEAKYQRYLELKAKAGA